MNIGIMSMQRVENYGSFLQAYGLKKVLESQGHTVSFVDYEVEPSLVKTDYKPNIALIQKGKNILKMLSPSYRRWRKEQLLINSTFGDFVDRYNSEFIKHLGINESRNITPSWMLW